MANEERVGGDFEAQAPRGLKNLGATCYFNGMAQVVLSVTRSLGWERLKGGVGQCMAAYYGQRSTKGKKKKRGGAVSLKELMLKLKIQKGERKRHEGHYGYERG